MAVHRQAVCAALHVPVGHEYVGVPALHAVGWQVPAVAPAHVYVESAQSAAVAQGSSHVPLVPWLPVHVCP